MSLPPQVNKPAKHRTATMKEPVHQSGIFYGMGPLDQGHADLNAGTSGLYIPEKVPQNLGHYQQQQPAQVKWMHQEAMQGQNWSQEPQLTGWGQNFPSYMGGVNVRSQMFHKNVHEGVSMPTDNQMQDVFRESTQQWEPMHQIQSYQHQQQQPQPQQQAPMLQPFQTFRQSKPQPAQFNPGYYATGFQQSKAMQGLGYPEQPKQQQSQPLLHQFQQQQHQQQIHNQQQIQIQQMQQQMRQYQQQCMQERHTQPAHQINQQNVHQTEPKQQLVRYQNQQENQKEESTEPNAKEVTTEAVAVVVNPATAAQPRRSRRLSREGQSPSTDVPQNGVGATGQRAEGVGQTGGVIQSTRRRRRASKEINLETLAQQAAKRESLPAKIKADIPVGRPSSMAPLVMPVSVPVPRAQEGSSSQGRPRTGERCGGPGLHKASVIVARRRSLRNSVSESSVQDGEMDSGSEEEGKPKPKRRPRPEPLIIPPPRPSSFIAPSVYSSITPYQSNLRSPVRPLERPLEPALILPPYTPPPILSPLRGGSGLYFSTFLSNMAAGTQVLPPQATPKSASVSLLRLSSTASSESTPPLQIVTDATPVSLQPRINMGPQYQAEIPDVLSPGARDLDLHKADLLWLPLEEPAAGAQDPVRDLMNLSCSSVFRGGGTNQELAMHCLFQSEGDIMDTVRRLLLQGELFPKGHPLWDYHYSGSDIWTPEEKRYFNKGISAYRKDFIMVQKLVQTKTVAQCVEFYYTYKKQVKVGRSGNLTFGPPAPPLERPDEVLENKSSLQPKVVLTEVEFNLQPEPSSEQNTSSSSEQSQESRHQARVAQSLQGHDYAASVVAPDPVSSAPPQPSALPRPRPEPQAKKSKPPPKAPADPDQVFPCKKCGRVFTKVKSRSAHMKSHSEQEKKTVALRLRQQEEREEQARARTLQPRPGAGPGFEPGTRARTTAGYQEQGSGAESSEADDAYDEDWR